MLNYSAIPEGDTSRVRFELMDPNTGEGGSAEALLDPRLIEALNKYNSETTETGRAFLIWINTAKNEVSWQIRKRAESKI